MAEHPCIAYALRCERNINGHFHCFLDFSWELCFAKPFPGNFVRWLSRWRQERTLANRWR